MIDVDDPETLVELDRQARNLSALSGAGGQKAPAKRAFTTASDSRSARGTVAPAPAAAPWGGVDQKSCRWEFSTGHGVKFLVGQNHGLFLFNAEDVTSTLCRPYCDLARSNNRTLTRKLLVYV